MTSMPPGWRRVFRWLRALGFLISLVTIYMIADLALVWRAQMQFNDVMIQHWSVGCTEESPCEVPDPPVDVCSTLLGRVPFVVSAWMARTRWRGDFRLDGGSCSDPERTLYFVGPMNLDTGESDYMPSYQ